MNIELLIFSLIMWAIGGLMLVWQVKSPMSANLTKMQAISLVMWAGPFMWIVTLACGLIILVRRVRKSFL